MNYRLIAIKFGNNEKEIIETGLSWYEASRFISEYRGYYANKKYRIIAEKYEPTTREEILNSIKKNEGNEND